MKCLKCSYQNIENAKFCKKCGEKLEGQLCPECRHTNPADFKFCEECGHDFSLQLCPECQHLNRPEYRFCEECGHDFSLPVLEPADPNQPPEKIAAVAEKPAPTAAVQPTTQASEPVKASTPQARPPAPAPTSVPPPEYRPYPPPPPPVYRQYPVPAKRKPSLVARGLKLVFGTAMGYVVGVLGNYLTRIIIAFVQVNFDR